MQERININIHTGEAGRSLSSKGSSDESLRGCRSWLYEGAWY